MAYKETGKMKIMKKLLFVPAVLTVMMLAAPAAGAASHAQSAGGCTQAASQRILTFPPWYNKLNCSKDGRPIITELNDIWLIAMNIIEWFIIAAAYLSAGFIIWGGFKYMKSRGDPGKLTEAKTAILQACVGLGITLISVAIVEFVTGIVSRS